MNIELFLLPIAAFNGKLHFYTQTDFEGNLSFPKINLSDQLHTFEAIKTLLTNCFSGQEPDHEFTSWLLSPRCKDRIIDVYDRNRLQEEKQSVAIVKAVSVADNIALRNKEFWHEPQELFRENSLLSLDNKRFLKDTLNLIPAWVKNTSFTFEIMCPVFSIQELRLLVGMLSNQEIDPGNFHRRLKKLDILKPLGSGQQRVHRWEFTWERSVALCADGLIP